MLARSLSEYWEDRRPRLYALAKFQVGARHRITLFASQGFKLSDPRQKQLRFWLDASRIREALNDNFRTRLCDASH
jgi:hypothetical protein